MTFLVEIRDFLIAQGEGGTAGAHIFLGDLPPDPDIAIAVLMVGGAPPETTMELEYRTFSLLVRGARNGYAGGYTEAERVRQKVHCGQIASGWVYCFSSAGTIFIGYDESRRPMFSCNFRACRAPDLSP